MPHSVKALPANEVDDLWTGSRLIFIVFSRFAVNLCSAGRVHHTADCGCCRWASFFEIFFEKIDGGTLFSLAEFISHPVWKYLGEKWEIDARFLAGPISRCGGQLEIFIGWEWLSLRQECSSFRAEAINGGATLDVPYQGLARPI